MGLCMKKTVNRLILVITALLLTTSAFADVTYTFTGLQQAHGGLVSLTVTTPNFITSDTTFAATGTNSSCTITGGTNDTCLSFEFVMQSFSNSLISVEAEGESDNYFFNLGTFSKPGIYGESFNTGRDAQLTIAETATPEPGSLVLLGSGLLGLGGAVRRKIIS
jgi:hypothetical protein